MSASGELMVMPTTEELQALAENVLDRKANPVESAFILARFVRDHAQDGKKLAEAIRKIGAAGESERGVLLVEALAMCKGVAR